MADQQTYSVSLDSIVYLLVSAAVEKRLKLGSHFPTGVKTETSGLESVGEGRLLQTDIIHATTTTTTSKRVRYNLSKGITVLTNCHMVLPLRFNHVIQLNVSCYDESVPTK